MYNFGHKFGFLFREEHKCSTILNSHSMRKILIALLSIGIGTLAMAQKTVDLGKEMYGPQFRVIIAELPEFSEKGKEKLKNDLDGVLALDQNSAGNKYSQLAVVVMGKVNTSNMELGPPATFSVQYQLRLIWIDMAREIILREKILNLVGDGESKQLASENAGEMIRDMQGDIQDVTTILNDQLVMEYNENCDLIMEKISAAQAEMDWKKAMGWLYFIPDYSSDCKLMATQRLVEYYDEYRTQQCLERFEEVKTTSMNADSNRAPAILKKFGNKGGCSGQLQDLKVFFKENNKPGLESQTKSILKSYKQEDVDPMNIWQYVDPAIEIVDEDKEMIQVKDFEIISRLMGESGMNQSTE